MRYVVKIKLLKKSCLTSALVEYQYNSQQRHRPSLKTFFRLKIKLNLSLTIIDQSWLRYGIFKWCRNFGFLSFSDQRDFLRFFFENPQNSGFFSWEWISRQKANSDHTLSRSQLSLRLLRIWLPSKTVSNNESF